MDTLLEARPSRHAEVALGPALLRGTKTAHVIFDRRVDRLYEVGPREHFILARLDGGQPLSEIGEQYAAHFGRRLGTAEWGRLLALLASRSLLASSPEPVPAQGQPTQPQGERPRRPWWFGNRPLPGLSALPERVYPWLRPFFSGYVQAVTAVAVPGLLVTLAVRLPELVSETGQLFATPWLLVPVLALLALSTVCHELSHALVARHYGVRTAQIGVRWTLPLITPYCTAQGVHALASRRQRIAVAAAGPVSHFVFLLPFFALWLALPDGPVRAATGALLLVNTIRGLLNGIPWPGTDGYQVLSHALNVSHLYQETFRFLPLIRQGRAARSGYGARAQWVYAGYAAGLIVIAAAILGTAACLGTGVLR